MDDRTRHVHIVAHSGPDATVGCAIDGIMASTDKLLQETEPFLVTWDLRNSPLPGPISTARLIAWASTRKRPLTQLTRKMGVLVPRGPLVGVVGSILNAFSGSTSTLVSSDEAEVSGFMTKGTSPPIGVATLKAKNGWKRDEEQSRRLGPIQVLSRVRVSQHLWPEWLEWASEHKK